MPDVEGAAIMTYRKPEDDTLREAFQSLAESAHGEVSAADLDLVWRAVSGDLPADGRKRTAHVNRVRSVHGVI